MNKSELENVKKLGGGGYLVAKNGSLTAQSNEDTCKNMQDNPRFLQISQNCENNKKTIKNSKNNNEFSLKNDFTKISNTNENYLENINAKVNDNYLNNKNFASLKNSYKNASCNNSANYKNDNGYKSCTTKCFATTKICLWLFLFVVCLAVVAGVGCSGGSNGGLKVAPTVETASAEGSPWSGSGTQTDPYQIGTYADLLALSTACNTPTSGTTYNHYQGVYFKLTANITIAAADLTGTGSAATKWTPIACDPTGTNCSSCYFSGIFDGNGKTITFQGEITKSLNDITAKAATLYYGMLFGYVNGGGTGASAYGIIQNVKIIVNKITFDGTSATNAVSRGFIGGIVGYANNSTISNCSFAGDAIFNNPQKIPYGYFGGIVGKAQNVIGCSYVGILDAFIKGGSAAILYVGGIAGDASVSKCYIEMYSTSKIELEKGEGNYCGIICGKGASNSYAKVNLSSFSVSSSTAAYWLNGNNCVLVIDGYPSTVSNVTKFSSSSYNCVIVGVDAKDISSSSGLYALPTSNANIDGLKLKETYIKDEAYTPSDTSAITFKWNNTTAYRWDFDTIWIIPNEGTDYPILRQFYVEPILNITLNVTTNLSGSTSGTTTGTSGAGAASGATAAVDQFIIYRFDELGNLVNQFVVRNGSTVTFEVDKNKAFTIMINYKLYMVTTIDAESTNKKTLTPTADTTIDIDITAPSGVNNWIVI